MKGGREEGERKKMERVKEVSRMIRSSGIKSEHSPSHTYTHTQGRRH